MVINMLFLLMLLVNVYCPLVGMLVGEYRSGCLWWWWRRCWPKQHDRNVRYTLQHHIAANRPVFGFELRSAEAEGAGGLCGAGCVMEGIQVEGGATSSENQVHYNGTTMDYNKLK